MVRPTKKQIIDAVNLVCSQPKYHSLKYACHALSFSISKEMLCDDSAANEFKAFYDIKASWLPEAGAGWFGNVDRPENQLARSLALLLYAEARKDVL